MSVGVFLTRPSPPSPRARGAAVPLFGHARKLIYRNTQPLWLGGTQGENGIAFIHTYPEVEGAQPISEEEGLYFSGDMESASRVVTDGPGSGFNFRFFAQVGWCVCPP